MHACLIYNPRAGSAERLGAALLELRGGHRIELRPVTRPGEAAAHARAAGEGGFDRILVAGGDGTVSEVVSGIAPDFDAVELGVLPLGTGNDLARCLGLDADRPAEALRVALGSSVAPIDVGRVSHGTLAHFVNVANGGFGGHLAADVDPEEKRRWGSLAYWMTGVAALVDLPAFEVEVELDGRRLELEAHGVAVANGRYVGGGFPMAPRALLDDGQLDVTVISVAPSLELIGVGLGRALGRDDDGGGPVQSHRAREVRLRSTPPIPFSLDGEPFRTIEATFDLLPGALRVAVGSAPVGLSQRPQERG